MELPDRGAVHSSPAVEGGRVYVGSNDGEVYCLDAGNGSLIWRFETGSTVHSSPAVAEGMVFVGSYDGNVYCLDAGDGSLVWMFKTSGYVHPSPTVADGRVFFGSHDGGLYCLGQHYFSVTVEPTSGPVVQGESVTAAVIVSATGLENVALSAGGVPHEAAVEFTPPFGIKTFRSAMMIATSPATPTGTYTITITSAEGYGRIGTAMYVLTVVGPYERTKTIALIIVLPVLVIVVIILLVRRRISKRLRKRVLESIR